MRQTNLLCLVQLNNLPCIFHQFLVLRLETPSKSWFILLEFLSCGTNQASEWVKWVSQVTNDEHDYHPTLMSWLKNGENFNLRNTCSLKDSSMVRRSEQFTTRALLSNIELTLDVSTLPAVCVLSFELENNRRKLGTPHLPASFPNKIIFFSRNSVIL